MICNISENAGIDDSNGECIPMQNDFQGTSNEKIASQDDLTKNHTCKKADNSDYQMSFTC